MRPINGFCMRTAENIPAAYNDAGHLSSITDVYPNVVKNTKYGMCFIDTCIIQVCKHEPTSKFFVIYHKAIFFIAWNLFT